MKRNHVCSNRYSKPSTLACTLFALAFSTAASLAFASEANKPAESFAYRSSVLVLSEKIGDVGREAIAAGLPTTADEKSFKSKRSGIIYVDVDSVRDGEYRAVFDAVRSGLAMGQSAVIETSDFNFEKMHEIVASEFPMIERSTIEDVAVLLRTDFDKVTALRIDPSELAMYGGVGLKDTAAGKARELTHNVGGGDLGDLNAMVSRGSSTAKASSLSVKLKDPLTWAIRAYDQDPAKILPGDRLVHNGTFVDLWKRTFYVFDQRVDICAVAWRGTSITNPFDVAADLRSQGEFVALIPNRAAAFLQGGRGFVSRLNAYSEVLRPKILNNCTLVMTTGHSLGAAVSQLHGIQLAYDPDLKDRLLGVIAWNSPNVVTSLTRAYVLQQFARLGNDLDVVNRRNDGIVNSVPTGLVRLGPANSAHVSHCTYVGAQVSPFFWANHTPADWYPEIEDIE